MLVLDVLLVGTSYEASLASGNAEWPPHPARAFSALVAVAEPASPDDDALRWLEAQAPPLVVAPEASSSRRSAYVTTNAINPRDSHQTYLGRSSGSRSWSRSLPARDVTRFVWPSAQPDQRVLDSLQVLARKVPYLGRSTSPALLSFSVKAPDDSPDLWTYHPDAKGSLRLRVARPGRLSELRSAYEDPALERPRDSWASYRAPGQEPTSAPSAPPPPAYSHLVTLGLQPGVALDGRHALAVAAAFKAAVLSRLGTPRAPDDDWPPLDETALALLHGHYEHRTDARRQCAVLALPAVGHLQAHGDILGVAIAVSPDLDRGVLGPLLRLCGFDRDPEAGPRLRCLVVPGVGRFRLERADGRRTLDPQRWSATDSTWQSVLPIVVDHHPRRNYTPADAIADGCEFAGLDRPARVEVHPTSKVPGAPYLVARDRQRPNGHTPPAYHATLHFPRPVQGPVVVGHLRHLGLGLCLPAGPRRRG